MTRQTRRLGHRDRSIYLQETGHPNPFLTAFEKNLSSNKSLKHAHSHSLLWQNRHSIPGEFHCFKFNSADNPPIAMETGDTGHAAVPIF